MDTDLSHWWLAKLVVAQALYLGAFIWGMRYLCRRQARIRGAQTGFRHPARAAVGAMPASAPKL